MARLSVALLVLAASRAYATTYAVEIEPRGAPAWQAEALAAALTIDLADPELRAAKPADVVVRGELAPGELHYTITGTHAPLAGTIALAGLARHELAGRLRDQVHALVQPHAVAPGPPVRIAEPSLGIGALTGLAALAALLAAPLVLAIVRRQRVWRLRGPPRLVVALGGVVVAGFVIEGATELGAWLFLAGGLAWGAFAAVTLPIALPPLVGLQRVEHGELVPTLTTWLLAALQRSVAVALVLVPAGFLLDRYAAELGVSDAITLGVIAPCVGLAVRLSWLALVEVLALELDRTLVDGDATPTQPWHAQVRAYFVGYLRRANLDIDEPLLERVRFLPGTRDAVAVYGGGLAHTRIVVPRAMLEHALAPYGRPHDYLEPRVSTLHWTHWNAGLVMPTEPDAKLASADDRKPHQTVEEGESERIALGEPPTLAGVIEPVAFDPRTSYRPGDDPLWLDWDPGEEYDGTDAGDKDYLFGVVVHALGVMQRGEERPATIALAWGANPVARVLARITAPVRAFATRQSLALGDAHAALGGARHHLVQYLAWRAWHRDDLVTARAYVPQLEHASRAITAALDPDTDAALHRRIVALHVMPVRPPRSQRTRLALAFAALAALAGVAALVVQATLYHSTYTDRIAADKKKNERPADGK